MKIAEIIEAWKHDTKVDDLNIDLEVLKIPGLHSKYLEWLSTERGALRGLLIQRRKLVQNLRDWYAGHMSQEELKKFNRVPCLIHPRGPALQNCVDSDDELLSLDGLISIQEEKVDVLKEIVSSIAFRNNQFTNVISWKRLLLGG